MEEQLASMNSKRLLQTHTKILGTLAERGILRSFNNPTGDLGEYLFCHAFNWAQEPNSRKAFDAIDKASGIRFQIKARHQTKRNKSRQLSALRKLDESGFDKLAAVIFDEDWTVLVAALIPIRVVKSKSRFVSHTDSHKFTFRDTVLKINDVEDVTGKLRYLEY